MNRAYQLSLFAYHFLRASSPIKTGNLRYNAIKVEQKKENESITKIDGNIAPYAVYTNEKWVSPKWHGKQNPHEKWIDKSAQNVAEIISIYVGGQIIKASGVEQRWRNESYWEKVRSGEIKRNDNITGIE